MSAYEITVIVLICEFVLMAFVHCLFDLSFRRFRWANYLNERLEKMQIHLKQGKWTSRLLQIGWLGPLFITALPFSGGVWTGMALSHVMTFSNRQTLWSVGAGAILGCLIFLLAALGILTIVEIPSA